MPRLFVNNMSISQLSAMFKPLEDLPKNRLFNRVEKVGYMAIAALVITTASAVGAVSTYDNEAKTSSKTNRFFTGLSSISASGLLLLLVRLVQLAFKASK